LSGGWALLPTKLHGDKLSEPLASLLLRERFAVVEDLQLILEKLQGLVLFFKQALLEVSILFKEGYGFRLPAVLNELTSYLLSLLLCVFQQLLPDQSVSRLVKLF